MVTVEDQAVRPPRRSETMLKMGLGRWKVRQWSGLGALALWFARRGRWGWGVDVRMRAFGKGGVEDN